MAISYVGCGFYRFGTDAISVSVPHQYKKDDLLLLLVESANQAVPNIAGWNNVSGSPVANTGTAGAAGAVRLTILYKFANTYEPYVAISDLGDHVVAGIIAIRGVDKTNPFNAYSSKVQASGSTALSWNAVKTTVNNAFILNVLANDADILGYAAHSCSNANLSEFSERIDYSNTVGTGGGLALYTGFKAVAGSTGTTTGTSTNYVARVYLTLALTPASGDTDFQLTSQTSYNGVWGTELGIIGQTFTTGSSSSYLKRASFFMQRGTVPYNSYVMRAYLYEHTGTYGTSGKPADNATILARSNDVSILAIGGDFAWVGFYFDGTYQLQANTQYCLALEIYGGDSGVPSINLGFSSSSSSHSGNFFTGTYKGTSFTVPAQTYDLMFKVDVNSNISVLPQSYTTQFYPTSYVLSSGNALDNYINAFDIDTDYASTNAPATNYNTNDHKFYFDFSSIPSNSIVNYIELESKYYFQTSATNSMLTSRFMPNGNSTNNYYYEVDLSIPTSWKTNIARFEPSYEDLVNSYCVLSWYRSLDSWNNGYLEHFVVRVNYTPPTTQVNAVLMNASSHMNDVTIVIEAASTDVVIDSTSALATATQYDLIVDSSSNIEIIDSAAFASSELLSPSVSTTYSSHIDVIAATAYSESYSSSVESNSNVKITVVQEAANAAMLNTSVLTEIIVNANIDLSVIEAQAGILSPIVSSEVITNVNIEASVIGAQGDFYSPILSTEIVLDANINSSVLEAQSEILIPVISTEISANVLPSVMSAQSEIRFPYISTEVKVDTNILASVSEANASIYSPSVSTDIPVNTVINASTASSTAKANEASIVASRNKTIDSKAATASGALKNATIVAQRNNSVAANVLSSEANANDVSITISSIVAISKAAASTKIFTPTITTIRNVIANAVISAASAILSFPTVEIWTSVARKIHTSLSIITRNPEIQHIQRNALITVKSTSSPVVRKYYPSIEVKNRQNTIEIY